MAVKDMLQYRFKFAESENNMVFPVALKIT